MATETVEVTESPEILFNATIPVTNLTLFGRRFGDSVYAIDQSLIQHTTSHVYPGYPDGFAGWSYRQMGDNKFEYFIFRDGEDKRKDPGTLWPLEERIAFVIEHGGGLTVKDGHGYGVDRGRISTFSVNPAMFDSLRHLSKRETIERFGLPDYITKDYRQDMVLFSTELFYTRGLSLCYFDVDHVLLNLHICVDISHWVEESRPKPYTGRITELFY